MFKVPTLSLAWAAREAKLGNAVRRRPQSLNRDVHCQFSLCFADLGFNWGRLFHLREEAAIDQRDGWGDPDDCSVILHRFGLGDVAGRLGDYLCGLFPNQVGVLRTHRARGRDFGMG